MTTHDPYQNLSELKSRDEYPGYDDFVPYRSDWRYGVSLFSLLMIGAIVYSYWQFKPDDTITAAIKSPAIKSVTKVIEPAKSVATAPPEAATAVARKKTFIKPKAAVVKKTKEAKPVTAPDEVKPQAITPVTGPSGH